MLCTKNIHLITTCCAMPPKPLHVGDAVQSSVRGTFGRKGVIQSVSGAGHLLQSPDTLCMTGHKRKFSIKWRGDNSISEARASGISKPGVNSITGKRKPRGPPRQLGDSGDDQSHGNSSDGDDDGEVQESTSEDEDGGAESSSFDEQDGEEQDGGNASDNSELSDAFPPSNFSVLFPLRVCYKFNI